MVTVSELMRAVDGASATTAQGLEPWPDPHPDRAPLDEEYSRVLDPRKWRIIPARAEAWSIATVDLGLATIERDVAVRWATDRGRSHVRVDRLVPRCVDGLPLVLAYSAFEGVDVNAVTIGVGDPAVEVTGVPPCGCDACDSGSQAEQDLLDEHMLGVVGGQFRHLTDGERTIVVHGAHRWSASGDFERDEVDRVLADPRAWHEVTGPSWLPEGDGEPMSDRRGVEHP